MRRTPLVFIMLLSAVVLGTTACGDGSDVPAGAVAVVDGTVVPRSALDELIARQKVVYATQKQAFPKADSKSYNDIQRNYVVYLVQQVEFEQQAKKLGVTVSQKDVEAALATYIASNFAGNSAKFRQYMKAQGFTLTTFKKTLRASALIQKVLAEATTNVKVDDRDLVAYYKLNRSTKYAHAPFKKVKDSIYTTVLDQKRAEANIAWIQNLPNLYQGKIDYGKGFEPPGS